MIALSGFAQEPPKPPELPKPFETKSVRKFPKVVGWPEGGMPKAPEGFTVAAFADKLDRPRWLYVLPNGDLLLSQAKSMPKPKKVEDPEKKAGQEKAKLTGPSPNNIIRLRDADNDGKAEVRETFLADLRQPFGMALVGDQFFVGNTDAVVKFKYDAAKHAAVGEPEKILDLPAGGYNNHWTRNVYPSKDGKHLFVTVGSGTNVDVEKADEKDPRRAAVLRCDLDGKNMKVFGAGLRNPNGLAWEPKTGALWTAVNERDELGDDLVPDYVTSVKEDAFYGWPYSYFGQNEDPRKKGERPDLVAKAIAPDVPVGAHTASLGLAFCESEKWPEKYRGGLFVGQRGSWNRSKFSGYRVAFVPFKGGKPSGPPEDFLSGFIKNDDEVFGQPVGLAFGPDGGLFVADESGKTVWKVTPSAK